MTEQELVHIAPSIFADHAHADTSKRYGFVPTATIVRQMVESGFNPIYASEQHVRKADRIGFQKHMIRFRHEDWKPEKVGDVLPEIVLVNSHDRTSAFTFHAGIFRLVCSNGMVVADSTIESIHIRHSGNILEDVVAGTAAIAKSLPLVFDEIKRFTSRILSQDEQLTFATAGLMLKYDNEEDIPIVAQRVLAAHRQEDVGDDLWRVFNRVQENLIVGGQRGNVHNYRRTRGVRGIDQGISLNKGLWELGSALLN